MTCKKSKNNENYLDSDHEDIELDYEEDSNRDYSHLPVSLRKKYTKTLDKDINKFKVPPKFPDATIILK